ncbi:Bromodomain-containing protein [Irpex rosettiformis]|uniref:Bromodomain-containing protein n=1 Tax=Irpex rosettiformis TaxID=378272 RepID=A0ACB8UJ93_9APHY|nr:Bromodomain-containing protein [Irpex rosettiformis]
MPSMKREATLLATTLPIDVDAPRAKRHKPAQPSVSATSQANEDQKQQNDASGVVQNDGAKSEGVVVKEKEDAETVKERGMKVWQVIKDATNKEGRSLSHDFLRLPSKRQYPDYYEQIKRPVALDDIKRKLESGQYANFEEAKHDFEQCFRNAKKYNMKESQIWKDAKHLHKLALLECEKLGASQGDAEAEGADGGSGSEAEDGDKKNKKQNKNRLLKSRLQKLVQKTADDGRVLSGEFMDLPNKKLWPSYYKVIKRPRSFEMIFKHLKRKEYETVLDFANDVELIFSNALEFNQEHTQIWEDAIVLRDHFRQLMSTLPAPYSIPAYANTDRSTKIKLKFHAPSHGQPAASTSQTVVSPKLYMPTIHVAPLAFVAHHPPPPPVARNGPPPPPQSRTPLPSAPPMLTAPSQSSTYSSQISPPIPPPPSFSPANFNTTPSTQYYLNTTFHASTPPTTTHYGKLPERPSSSQLAPPPPLATQAPILTVAKSPTPPDEQLRRKLRRVDVVTRPAGRRIRLDWKDGVKSWAVRLGREETSVRIEDVRLVVPGEEEESDDEGKENQGQDGKGKDNVAERHEEEEEAEEEEEDPKPQQKRGRGRPRKKRTRVIDSPSSKGKGKGVAVLPPEDVQVRLNGMLMPRGNAEKSERLWDVQIPLGNNMLEIGEPEGKRWRMYLERLAHS